MPEQESPDDARERAYRQGQREAGIDAQLLSHERRLGAINGSIDRSTERMRDLAKSIDALGDQIRNVSHDQQTRLAVEQALHERLDESTRAVQTARETQISARMLLVCTASVLVGIVGVIVTVLIATHAFA